jgi:hypothetical protein
MTDFLEAGQVRSPQLDAADALMRAAVKALRALPYHEYLKTEHWLDFRESMLRSRDDCQYCDATIGLQVHHLTYDYLGRERPSDVLVLCAKCHQAWHDTHKERLSTPTTDLVWAGRTRRFGRL